VEGGEGGKEGKGISFACENCYKFRSEKVSLMKYSRFANSCHLTLGLDLRKILVQIARFVKNLKDAAKFLS